MKSNLFFIIGIRRSGTSILRELIMKHPQIAGCEFEPHDLWAAVDLNHFPRLMKKENVFTFAQDTIGQFQFNGINAQKENKWYGAKFALNPGVKALEWIWLKKTFPEAKFIFITRDVQSTWQSYKKQDKNSVRGLMSKSAYFDECDNLMGTYKKANDAAYIDYEDLLRTPNRIIEAVYWYLGLKIPSIDFKQFIKQPEF